LKASAKLATILRYISQAKQLTAYATNSRKTSVPCHAIALARRTGKQWKSGICFV